MQQGKVNRDNYIVVQGWMITDLELKGNELLVYACIYGFSQAENQVFNGGLKYLAEWTNSTKQGVIKNLKSLEEKGYIDKYEKYVNGIKVCEYCVTKFNGVKQSLTGGGKQSLTNNKAINNINILIMGAYKNVKLKEEEFNKLVNEYGEAQTLKAIEYLSEYIELKGYKAKSHYLALKKWVFTALKEQDIKQRELQKRENNLSKNQDTSWMSHHFKGERKYSKEELDALIVDMESAEF